MGWLDEREPGADRLCVVDTVIGVEVLARHDLNPGAHDVEPSVDVLGELMLRGEPRQVVVAWALDVGHGHAMKRGGWPKRLGNMRAVLLHPHDLFAGQLFTFTRRDPGHIRRAADGWPVIRHRDVEPELTVAGGVCRIQRVAHHPDVHWQLEDRSYIHVNPPRHTFGLDQLARPALSVETGTAREARRRCFRGLSKCWLGARPVWPPLHVLGGD